ncbi:hypothetical protein QOT17_005627 [Balamuthia mandrillaris]
MGGGQERTSRRRSGFLLLFIKPRPRFQQQRIAQSASRWWLESLWINARYRRMNREALCPSADEAEAVERQGAEFAKGHSFEAAKECERSHNDNGSGTEDGLPPLPVEIWHVILSFLRGRQVRKAAQVCRTWKDLLQTREKRQTLFVWGNFAGSQRFLEAYSPPLHAAEGKQVPSSHAAHEAEERAPLWTVPFPRKEVDIVQVSAGWKRALLLDSKGRAWELDLEALSNGPAVVKELSQERVVHVAASEYHYPSLLLCVVSALSSRSLFSLLI